jgi:hypothetical protein
MADAKAKAMTAMLTAAGGNPVRTEGLLVVAVLL